jgi:hypothetical protein
MLAIELAAYLDRVRPRRILEVGSGYSTAILAAYATYHDAEVVTLEHEATYFRATRRALRQLGVDRPVDLRLAPLTRQWFGDRGPYWWYGVTLDGDFDFVFIDGPPKVLGRRAAFFALQGHLRPDWRVWVDDGSRRHERQCVKLWHEEFSGIFVVETRCDIDGKSVFDLRDANAALDQAGDGASVGQLGIGVLVNGDHNPNWWGKAERALGSHLLDSSYVVAVDREEPSGRPLPKTAARFVDDRIPADGRLPERMLRMLRSLVSQPGVRYVLYLDDRWSATTLDTSWLPRGLDILEHRPEVEQVSLRHLIDVGLTDGGGQGPFPMAFAREPSLLGGDRLRAALRADGRIRRLWPGSTRRPALLSTVQLSPGVFRRSDTATAPVEVALGAADGHALSPGGVVQAARGLMAAVGNLRPWREESLENSLVDLTPAAAGRPARRA